MRLLTPDDIIELSVTTEPITVGHHWRYTIDDLMKETRASEWDGWLRLRPFPAARIARRLNTNRPWKRHAPTSALAALPAPAPGDALVPVVIEGELIP